MPVALLFAMLAAALPQLSRATEVTQRGGQVQKDAQVDPSGGLDQVFGTQDNPWTLTTPVLTPPGGWTFKLFDTTHVDIQDVDVDGFMPRRLMDYDTQIQVEITVADYLNAAMFPLLAEGNLKPPPGGHGAPAVFHWKALALAPKDNAIYHINIPKAAHGFGHSAAIIPNPTVGNPAQVTYYSYGDGGGNLVTTQTRPNIAAALAWARTQGYTRGQYWNINNNQAQAARNAAVAFHNTQYDAQTHNCWHMVHAALDAANVFHFNRGPSPNEAYLSNRNTADGYGDL
ncbi:MAG: hypothetical protein WD042_10130 [Phycisphaeraceae bacterium]